MNKKCDWAYRMLEQWIQERNATIGNDSDQVKIVRKFLDMPNWEIAYCLTCFIIEVRKKNGLDYPAETLYEIIVCLQLWLHMRGRSLKLLDDEDFVAIRNCLDNRMKELSRDGHVQPRNQADVITVDQENDMWLHNILGSSNPKQLVETILYLFGVHFAMRAGVEHRSLRVGLTSQITIHSENGVRYLLYKEDVSKTKQGGLKHRKIKPKEVRAYENIANPDRCIVNLYLKYLSVRPDIVNTDFYLCPLACPCTNVWYSCQPIGKNKLTTIVAEMTKKAGIEGKITNHSLRASSASCLYNCNVDKQLICEVTGHRSNAVRAYKRTSDDQCKNISSILYGQGHTDPLKVEESDGNCGESIAKKRKIEVPITVEEPSKGLPVYINVNVNFSK